MFGTTDPLTVFPQNLSLLEFREAIKGRNDYREITYDDEGFVLFSYLFMGKDTFLNPNEEGISEDTKRVRKLLRECRGIVFSTEGKILARRFHKFFNVNEGPETHEGLVDLSHKHVLLVKLDGSMVSPIVHNGHIFWATKKGLNDVEDMANSFVLKTNSIDYSGFVMNAHAQGITCMFEWCSKKQPIILNYTDDDLILTSMRHTESGLYVNYDEMKKIAAPYKIPVVQEFKHDCKNIKDLLQKVKSQQGIEGFVLRFENGECLKIKTTWYVDLSRGLQSINFFKGKSNEKYIWKIVLDSSFDDLKEGINETEREKLETFATKLMEAISVLHDYLFKIVKDNIVLTDAKFAEYIQSRKDIKSVISICWKIRHSLQKKPLKGSIFDLLVELIKNKATKSSDDLAEIRTVIEHVNAIVTEKEVSLSL